MKKYLLSIATLFLAVFINLNAASAQDTTQNTETPKPPTAAQTGSDDFQKASAIFTGQVLQVDRKENDPNATVKFSIQKMWKGKNAKEIKLATTKDSGECVNFEVGKTYRVYASEINGKNQINCSKTGLAGETAVAPAKEN